MGVSVGKNEQHNPISTGVVNKRDTIDQFDLRLVIQEIGLDGVLYPIGSALVIGQQIRVNLETEENHKFQFVLFDCEMGGTHNMLRIYDEQCPNENSRFVNAEWLDPLSFNAVTSRFQDSALLRIICTVRIYKTDGTWPTPCDTTQRRKRGAEDTFIKSTNVGIIIPLVPYFRKTRFPIEDYIYFSCVLPFVFLYLLYQQFRYIFQ